MSALPPNDIKLLVALKEGEHFKAHPGELNTLLPGISEPEALASFRRLLGQGFVKKVENAQAGIWLRITDAGMALADIEIASKRKPTIVERIRSISFSNWISLAALIVAVIALFRSGS